MNCEKCREAIGDYVDGALDTASRRTVEAHFDECASCRALAHDFDAIRRAAGTLERLNPPAGVWGRIEASLDAGRTRKALLHWRARPMAMYGWLGAAAALMIAVAASIVFVLREAPAPSSPRPDEGQSAAAAAQPDSASASGTVESIEAELKLAEQHYENAIGALEKIAAAQQQDLDPQVAATLQKNLGVIDRAIEESRAALLAQPQSVPAQESLFEALRRKVGLLQDAIALMNEMRKGNQAGAAQIVEGLSKS